MRYLLGTTAVAAALMFAAPAFAQQSYYDTNPTPAEKAQTRQLNSNAAAAAQTDGTAPAATPDDAAAPPPVAPSANDADYAAKKADYDAKMRDYNTQRDAYERDRGRDRAERDAYVHHWEVFYGYRGFRDVSFMHADTLTGLRVNARGGAAIGRVRDVDADGAGRVSRVLVDTGFGRRAWLDADSLRYDPAARVIYTDLTRDQVNDMSRMREPRY